MKSYLLIAWFALLGSTLWAQSTEQGVVLHKFVVADMETRIPIRDVRVITNTGYRDTTNYRGVCFLPTEFDTLIVYKANYLSEKLAFAQVRDTTYLIPRANNVGEVTAWGRGDLQNRVEEWAKRAAKEGAADGAADRGGFGLVFSFDLGNMLDKRGRHDKKQYQKNKIAFQKLDAKGNEDPIVGAYNRALDQKRRESELAEVVQQLAIKKDSLQEVQAQAALRSYEQQTHSHTSSSLAIATTTAHVYEGMVEDVEAQGEEGVERHTFYLQAAADSLQQAVRNGQMVELHNEESYQWVTPTLAAEWSKSVFDLLESHLEKKEIAKLGEKERTIIFELQLTQGGRVLMAKMRILDPYQGVMTRSALRITLLDLQRLHFNGLALMPQGQFITLSFLYPPRQKAAS